MARFPNSTEIGLDRLILPEVDLPIPLLPWLENHLTQGLPSHAVMAQPTTTGMFRGLHVEGNATGVVGRSQPREILPTHGQQSGYIPILFK